MGEPLFLPLVLPENEQPILLDRVDLFRSGPVGIAENRSRPAGLWTDVEVFAIENDVLEVLTDIILGDDAVRLGFANSFTNGAKQLIVAADCSSENVMLR
jgi:hypothetical protein